MADTLNKSDLVAAIAAFLTFFGLAGWGGQEAGWGTFPTMAVAAGAGLVMLVAVAWLIGSYQRLDSHGNVDLARAVGQSAKVYLRIPARRTGKGKITVSLQGRSLELAAMTAGEELATGSEVRIVRQTTPDTFEVEPLN